MYRTLGSFLKCHLPELMAGKPRLRASFVSYNHIGRHKTGPVRTEDPTLSVTAHIGDREWVESSIVSPVSEAAEVYRDTNGMLAIIAQQELAQTFMMPHLEDGDSMLLFVYAGRPPQFGEAVDFATGLKRENPSIDVIVVSCKCETYEKGSHLVQAIEDGASTFFDLYGKCDVTIFDRLIETWPHRDR